MEKIMLKLSEFSHNHHPSGVKMLANFIRRGIWVLLTWLEGEDIDNRGVVIGKPKDKSNQKGAP
jgi:hypothetical protein